MTLPWDVLIFARDDPEIIVECFSVMTPQT